MRRDQGCREIAEPTARRLAEEHPDARITYCYNSNMNTCTIFESRANEKVEVLVVRDLMTNEPLVSRVLVDGELDARRSSPEASSRVVALMSGCLDHHNVERELDTRWK